MVQIFLRFNGTIVLDVLPENPISSLKNIIQMHTGTKSSDMMLLYNGKVIDKSKTFNDYKIQKDDTIECRYVLR